MVSDRPSAFTFQLIPAFTPTLSVELSGGNLLVSSLDQHGAVISGTRFQATPSADEWSCFWDAVEFLDVWSWKENYDLTGGRDGEAWKLHLEHENKSVTAKGWNGYPAFDSPSKVSGSEDRMGVFLFSLCKLLSPKTQPTSGVEVLQNVIQLCRDDSRRTRRST